MQAQWSWLQHLVFGERPKARALCHWRWHQMGCQILIFSDAGKMHSFQVMWTTFIIFWWCIWSFLEPKPIHSLLLNGKEHLGHYDMSSYFFEYSLMDSKEDASSIISFENPLVWGETKKRRTLPLVSSLCHAWGSRHEPSTAREMTRPYCLIFFSSHAVMCESDHYLRQLCSFAPKKLSSPCR